MSAPYVWIIYRNDGLIHVMGSCSHVVGEWRRRTKLTCRNEVSRLDRVDLRGLDWVRRLRDHDCPVTLDLDRLSDYLVSLCG